MSIRADVLAWAQRIVAKRGVLPHQLLEVRIDASLDEAQEAFHRVARTGHPDLHRGTLTPAELELVTTAYARVAAAYQDLRAARAPQQTGRMRAVTPEPATGAPGARAPVMGGSSPGIPLPPGAGAPGGPGAAGAMSSKALIYYRKAELCLRRGDLRGAVLQLKMAIATDPTSQVLRTALAEVEAALK